jgi:hypothetical protein
VRKGIQGTGSEICRILGVCLDSEVHCHDLSEDLAREDLPPQCRHRSVDKLPHDDKTPVVVYSSLRHASSAEAMAADLNLLSTRAA